MADEFNVIEIRNLWVIINGRSILRDVNLEVEEGDFLGIIGPNGGGKTTLLKVLAGLIKPTYGEVKIGGKKLNYNSKYIGYVPQYSFFDYDFPITVEEVVLLGRIAHKKGRSFSVYDREKAYEMLQKVEMYDYRHRQIGELSGGERQRVLVARALALEPHILLLDEPTASADQRFAAGFYEILRDLNKEMTIILVSHDISAVSKYVNNIACLNQTLYFNEGKTISPEVIEKVYHCPVELIAHGVPHRVLPPHDGVVGD
ncbi:ABC transporter ATP-binding protein [Thermosyntropha sp.]|uniref:metal ABC transporter ATP-binding protein n=1 Tax=Thermosyntropha sp. TaxID=2740820 RepID=UPI0025D71FF7|nr:ABC transporter ATP-binding protein [Thermosyntropha sp.]MBO8158227.1 ABC transporter ATP-binding protein [Thermosyntropha sp.]